MHSYSWPEFDLIVLFNASAEWKKDRFKSLIGNSFASLELLHQTLRSHLRQKQRQVRIGIGYRTDDRRNRKCN